MKRERRKARPDSSIKIVLIESVSKALTYRVLFGILSVSKWSLVYCDTQGGLRHV